MLSGRNTLPRTPSIRQCWRICDCIRSTFLSAMPQRAAGSFVTARGWEDLSALLLTYEALGFACTQTQMREYLHVQEAAAGFAAFYELYRRYARRCA